MFVRRILAVSIVLTPGTLAAQPARAPATVGVVVARDSGARMERITDGVYAILHDDAILTFPSGATDWPHGNVGVIEGNDGVLVIDSDLLPSRAAADIALIRRVTAKPVRYLVNTHWHGDHTHGNAVYRDSFPAVTIVGARDNAQFIGVNQTRFARSATAEGSTTRAILARHESLLARGTDSTGRVFTAGERTLLARVIEQRRIQLTEFATIRAAPPTLLFDDRMTLDLGGRRVELVNRGHANSPADVTAYLPVERVLFTGDIVVWPVPYTFDAYPGPWARVLRDLEALPVTAMVPGHGPIFADNGHLRQVRELLEHAIAQADVLIRNGKLQRDVETTVDLDGFKARFVKPGDATAELFWGAAIRNTLMERVYQCLMGSRC